MLGENDTRGGYECKIRVAIVARQTPFGVSIRNHYPEEATSARNRPEEVGGVFAIRIQGDPY